MTKKNPGHMHVEDIDDSPSIDDLRVIVRHIAELAQLGDQHVVADARRALLLAARAAARRLLKTSRQNGHR